MTTVQDDQFDIRITAWLDDDQETGRPEHDDAGAPVNLLGPSDGAKAAIRAADEADSHPLCARDDRMFSVLVRVLGKDEVDTIVSVPPERTLRCFLGVLDKDDEVIAYQVLGTEPSTTYNPAAPAAPTVYDQGADDAGIEDLAELDETLGRVVRAVTYTLVATAALFLYRRYRWR